MIPEKVLIDLSNDIHSLFEADPENAQQRIEGMIKSRFADYSAEDGRKGIQQIIQRLQLPELQTSAVENELITRVFALLLGRRVAPDDFSSKELLERLVDSLNTIFDSLNQLIGVINLSFCSDGCDKDHTIRQFIGFHLEGQDQTQPLEEYLGKIGQAFLTTHEAFKRAAHQLIKQLLHDLDMEQIARDRGPGLKIGPLQKAEDYEIIKEKIDRAQKWFRSGRCMEDFLKEFEKNCQSLNHQ
jgi:hypothetical protein